MVYCVFKRAIIRILGMGFMELFISTLAAGEIAKQIHP